MSLEKFERHIREGYEKTLLIPDEIKIESKQSLQYNEYSDKYAARGTTYLVTQDDWQSMDPYIWVWIRSVVEEQPWGRYYLTMDAAGSYNNSVYNYFRASSHSYYYPQFNQCNVTFKGVIMSPEGIAFTGIKYVYADFYLLPF
ncbi:MAG TPA: hypothetical protein GX523_13290 [Desulfitobacterium dehalogenans]|uniref:Uncharacterized protein n=1 Tax=Desulfitobacterium dehalogenans TaxID=36854 RepID=A0A7C6Z5H5_9FIRM|nr:hypothetical protein [Desulfitobacterium dehalogenans]